MKKRRNSSYSIIMFLRWPLFLSALLVFLNLILLAVNREAAVAMSLFTLMFILVSALLYIYSRNRLYAGLIGFAQGFDSTQTDILNGISIPMAICSRKGALIWVNDTFAGLFGTFTAASSVTGVFPDITRGILAELDETAVIHSTYADRRYLVEMRPSYLGGDGRDLPDDAGDDGTASGEDDPGQGFLRGFGGASGMEIVIITVSDETELIRYKKDYEDTRACEGLIYLDNYEEALNSVEDVRRSLLTALVDRRISNYISSMNGIVMKLDKDKFFFLISEADIRRIMDDRFSILDEVKTINIGNELSMTLSIGVGRTGTGYAENYEYARAAIDLALGRGGDQAVVKSGSDVAYFGGRSHAQEKQARVKARVKAQAFREILTSCDSVLIMGHKNGDVDSFGASVGVWRIARSYGKKAHIVLNSVTKSLEPLYRLFADNPEYPEDMFVSGEKALSLRDPSTIVVVVDVNRPSITEEPELLEKAGTVVVIDHHRRGTESVENAALSYIEPYASSASEMTTELIQYIDDTTTVNQLEADALYGGIVVDTQNFVSQSGIRTFEAAAYLRRRGASAQRIRKLFRDSFSDFKAKAGAADSAEIYRDHFCISSLDPEGVDSPTVAGAQAANTLLNIDGIKAAFVLTPYREQIFVSARSIDEVNVQVMMEKIGGGGHMSMAGAQIRDKTVEEAKAMIRELIDKMIEEGEVS